MLRILAIAASTPWPDALGELIVRGEVAVETVPSIYDAAARFVLSQKKRNEEAAGKTGSGNYGGLLIDSTLLCRRDISLLATLRLHMPLPIWLLPTFSEHSPRYQEALSQGGVPWNEVEKILMPTPQQGTTPEIGKSSSKIFDAMHGADKTSPESLGKSAEMPMASGVVARYDETIHEPLLTQYELQALLGPIGSPGG